MLATCGFCSNPASLGPMPSMHVCRSCAKRIGEIAGDDRIWSKQARPARPMQSAAESFDVERVFEEFKAGVAKQLPVDDHETHFNLAEAYVEMGLVEDALREAGEVLKSAAPKLTPFATKITDLALRMLLTPPLLKPQGLARLRSLLGRSN